MWKKAIKDMLKRMSIIAGFMGAGYASALYPTSPKASIIMFIICAVFGSVCAGIFFEIRKSVDEKVKEHMEIMASVIDKITGENDGKS